MTLILKEATIDYQNDKLLSLSTISKPQLKHKGFAVRSKLTSSFLKIQISDSATGEATGFD